MQLSTSSEKRPHDIHFGTELHFYCSVGYIFTFVIRRLAVDLQGKSIFLPSSTSRIDIIALATLANLLSSTGLKEGVHSIETFKSRRAVRAVSCYWS